MDVSSFKNLVNWKLRRWHKIFIIVLYQCMSPVSGDVYVRTATLGSDVILPCDTNSSSLSDINWRKEGRHQHPGSVSPSGQFVISNFTLQDQGNYTCFYKNVKVDEVEVRVPYFKGESQSQTGLNSSSKQSEDDFADDHYLRVLSISTAVSVFALVTLISAIVLISIRHRSQGKQPTELKESPDEDESLELVPNITLNPSFNIDMLEHIGPEYSENSEHAFLVRADN